MAYDGVKQKYPGSPCAIGARIRLAGTGRCGTIVQPRPGEPGVRVRVRFDDEPFPRGCHPRTIEYLDAAPAPGPRWCGR